MLNSSEHPMRLWQRRSCAVGIQSCRQTPREPSEKPQDSDFCNISSGNSREVYLAQADMSMPFLLVLKGVFQCRA